MTIYDVQDGRLSFHHSKGTGPMAHALVIGVGEYKHLNGGSGSLTKKHMDLGQLTSPPFSATAFAKWLIEEFRNTQHPLGSVELLVSPSSTFVLPNGVERPTEAATMSNVSNAFDRWYKRCDADEGNMALFYFCGHGVLRENTALLLEDFGSSDNRAFTNAINMEMTHQGMNKCKAKLQCCFVDSCRQEAFKLGKQLNDPATVLIDPEFGAGTIRDAPIFYASAPGTLAYGLSGQVSRFTEALITCLRGRGAQRNAAGTGWEITSGSLGRAIAEIVLQMNRDGGEVQFSPTGGTNLMTSVLHQVDGEPEVPVKICCTPPAAIDESELTLRSNKWVYQRGPMTGPWSLNVKAAYYTASAKFPPGRWKDGECDVWAIPPGPLLPIIKTDEELSK
jgi:hypothetical protein